MSEAGGGSASSLPEAEPSCPVSGAACTRNCRESPERPELAGLCERLGFAPMRAAGPPEADPRPWRKFSVGAAGRSRVYMRCWVCGAPAEFGRPDEWVGLEELAGWATAHRCPAAQVTEAKPEFPVCAHCGKDISAWSVSMDGNHSWAHVHGGWYCVVDGERSGTRAEPEAG
jgi:hypothetical protein